MPYEIDVVFDPVAAVSYTGEVTLTDTAPGGQTVAVALTGLGTSAGPVFSVNPSPPMPLAFGPVVEGTVPALESFTITNAGSGGQLTESFVLDQPGGFTLVDAQDVPLAALQRLFAGNVVVLARAATIQGGTAKRVEVFEKRAPLLHRPGPV